MTVSKSPIVVNGLYKDYGRRRVLRGLDLEAARGEVFCLLGPNGAGKTTTVEILEGYRDATAGFVRVLGFDPSTHPRELRQRTGVVLQECGFPNHLRVGELLDGWRAYYPAPRPLDELLEVVELGDERATLVRRLSGGQRRRLDFALALAGDPDLIFLDEPTTGFDPEARRRCWSAIENLQALGKTVLLTTHYLDEAEHLADRVAILIGGTIRAVGTVHELTQLAQAPTHISYRSPCGDRVTVETTDAGTTLRSLLDSLAELPELDVSPPTLEDTYLELVTQ
ncbi:MAG: type transport system ATP-binding protein [Acidimicrobiaceae bacterium]|jgi:ABC-2 type transport system ATP-binding protein